MCGLRNILMGGLTFDYEFLINILICKSAIELGIHYSYAKCFSSFFLSFFYPGA